MRDEPGRDGRARWNAWRTEVFGDGYMVWHEGADTDASTAPWRQDPAGTTTALMLGLAEDDHVAAQAVEAFARSGGAPGFGASPRATAARLLTGVPVTAAVADALADAVADDPDYLVRYHATQSLLAFAGSDRELRQPMVETISERGTAAGRLALARDLRARVQTVD